MERLFIATTSFNPRTWECLACVDVHKLLPKKRNISQWEGGSKLVILSDQNMGAMFSSAAKLCPAVIRIEDGSLGELGDALC
jgi:hypothetical protein